MGCVLRCFQTGTIEVAGRANGERLFQREEARERNALELMLVLTLDKVMPLFDLSERDESDVTTME